jgi:uncharacterized protein involved in exopolysaccharide biosynthesis
LAEPFQHPVRLTDRPPTFLEAVVSHWPRILRDTAIATAVLAGATLLIPNRYTASAVVLPPSAEADFGGLLSTIPGGSAALSRAFGLDASSETSIYLGVLRSASVRDSLVRLYGLQTIYKSKNAEKARRKLAEHTSLLLTNDGFVEIAVTEKDRQLAARLANAYVEQLDRFLQVNANSGASRRRQFLENRLASSQRELAVAEDALRDYQVRMRMPVMSLDADRAGSAAANLMAEKLSREVELGTIESVALGANPRAEQLRNELRQIDAELTKIPPATTVLARMVRDVRIQEKVLLVLREEFERARVLELKNIPTVQVVDRAQPPIEKSAPRRTLIAIAILVVVFTVRSVLAWMRERALRGA